MSNYDSVKRMFDALPKPPDVVVSNAAVSMATATVLESDPSTWFKEIDINIKGAYTVAKIYLDAVQAAGKEGCLINVSSNASWRYIPGKSSYTMSKVAMNALSEYIHREGGPVRCKTAPTCYPVKRLLTTFDDAQVWRCILEACSQSWPKQVICQRL